MNQPQLYSENNYRQVQQGNLILDDFLKLIKWQSDSDTILDVGVGDGKFAVEYLIPRLPRKFGKFVGSDISESMLAFSKEKYELPNLEFKQLDIGINVLPSEFHGGFDHIFSFYTLHWVREQRKAFFNMHKILKPGGDMLLMYFVKNPLNPVFNHLTQHPKWKHYDHTKLITPVSGSQEPRKELEQILTEAGFCNINCKIQEAAPIYSNLEELNGLLISVNPYVFKMSEKERSNYISDITEDFKTCGLYTSEIVEGKKVFSFKHDIFVVYASKPI